VNLNARDEGLGDWICLKCAAKLQRQLKAAIEKVKRMEGEGRIYRNDRWIKARRG